MIKNRLFLQISITAFALFCLTVASTAVADLTASDSMDELQKTCVAISNKWIGLKMHYSGRREFKNRCEKAIRGKDIVSGLWAIRSLMPDGHAGFSVKTGEPSQIYPIVLNCDPFTGDVVVGAVFDKSVRNIKGKKVISINGEKPIALIERRAKLEPQSTRSSSLEIAARMLLFQYRGHPYPDFPPQVELVFADGGKITLKPEKLYSVVKKNPYSISNNLYPSIWGDKDFISGFTCKTETEVAGIIEKDNLRWLWWHPMDMAFDTDDLGSSLRCFISHIGRVDGVIVDLRDTAGGFYDPAVAASSILGAGDKLEVQVRDLSGKTSHGTTIAPGYAFPRWNGRVVMITNGLCGSACDMLADLVVKRKDVCSYGTPTGGRRFGYETFNIDKRISFDIAIRNYLGVDGKTLEGTPVVPQHKGANFDLNSIFSICAQRWESER